VFAPPALDAFIMPVAQEARHVWLLRLAAGAAVASGGLLSANAAISLNVVERLTRASAANNASDFSPFELGVPWETVRIPAAHDELISGWRHIHAETEPVIVC
jgi:hypothetical protein